MRTYHRNLKKKERNFTFHAVFKVKAFTHVQLSYFRSFVESNTHHITISMNFYKSKNSDKKPLYQVKIAVTIPNETSGHTSI